MVTVLSKNAQKVLEHRYLRKNEKGEFLETPSKLFRRVAKAVGNAETNWGGADHAAEWEDSFYNVLSQLMFLPNSPTLMNAGTKLNQLSACFVLPVEDSMDGIFTTLKQAALIQQSGGGTGFNFSHLRPRNDFVSETSGVASGPVSFMKIFNAATDHIKQGGKRRGANMGILNIDHPDIEEFIYCKKEEGVLNSFNISTGIPDAFMNALEKDGSWELRHPNKKNIVKVLKARHLWNAIIENAWGGGDPGLIFLDNVIEINSCLVPEIKAMVQGNRKIGLGVMGWADLLVMLEIPYDTEEAIRLAAKLMEFMREKSYDASVELAKQRGPFKNQEQSIYHQGRPIRNATRLSIAPTGTISIIADASSSIEPLFALAFHREGVLDGEELISINPYFTDYLKTHQLFTDKIIQQVMNVGSAKNVSGLPLPVKNIFKTAMDIAPEWHLRHQAVFQQFTDNAVSKTVNLPETATAEDVAAIYKAAWQQKLKGITIFRNNCRHRQVLHAGVLSKSDACKMCIQ